MHGGILALASTKPLRESNCFSFVGRDESSLVGIEAIRALSGHFPPRKAGLGLDGSTVEVSPGDARSRARAWQVRTPANPLKLQIHIESWPRYVVEARSCARTWQVMPSNQTLEVETRFGPRPGRLDGGGVNGQRACV